MTLAEPGKQVQLYLVPSPVKVVPRESVKATKPQSATQDKRGRQQPEMTVRPGALASYEDRMRWLFQQARKRYNLRSQNALAEYCDIDSGQFSRLITRRDTIALKFFADFVTKTRANPSYALLGVGEDFL
jgi:hypothetical protein